MYEFTPFTRLRNFIYLRRAIYAFFTLGLWLNYEAIRQAMLNMAELAFIASEDADERHSREIVRSKGTLPNGMKWEAEPECYVMDMGSFNLSVGAYEFQFAFLEGEASLSIVEPGQCSATQIAQWNSEGCQLLSYLGKEPTLWKALSALIVNPIVETIEERSAA